MWERRVSLLVLVVAAVGCRQDMHDQPRYEPLAYSAMFPSGRSARPAGRGVVARGELAGQGALVSGLANGTFATAIPVPIDTPFMARGRDRYQIYCSPCHGLTGDGDGMISQRGFLAPPSLHSERSRALPPGYVFLVISNGFGAMPDYGSQIGPRDRWAIVAYLGALQVSHGAPR